MTSLHRYKLLLREPHIAGAYLASIVGRLPIGMAVLAILLFIQHVDKSYARAGLASALYVCGIAVVSPLIGRIVDRVGPRLILLILALVYPLALAGLVWAVRDGASTTVLGMAAFAAGAALPPVSSCIRTLVRKLLHDGAQLQAAYSLDSVIMESVFIMGPGIVSVFAAFGWPAGAVGCAALCGMAGAIKFERSTAVSRWSVSAVAERVDRASNVAAPGLIAIFATTFFYSAGFGLFEVAVTAVAARAGTPAAAGLILAFTSAGSAAGVLWYGSRSWPLSVPNQYKVALASLLADFLVLAPIENLYLYCIVSVAKGLPMSTVVAAQAVLIAAVAPRGALAESFTWSAASLLVGVSLGIAVGGMLLEHYPPSVPVALAALMTGIGLLIASMRISERKLGLDAVR